METGGLSPIRPKEVKKCQFPDSIEKVFSCMYTPYVYYKKDTKFILQHVDPKLSQRLQ